MGVKVYISGQTFSNQVRNEQRTILDFLRGNGIEVKHSTETSEIHFYSIQQLTFLKTQPLVKSSSPVWARKPLVPV